MSSLMMVFSWFCRKIWERPSEFLDAITEYISVCGLYGPSCCRSVSRYLALAHIANVVRKIRVGINENAYRESKGWRDPSSATIVPTGLYR